MLTDMRKSLMQFLLVMKADKSTNHLCRDRRMANDLFYPFGVVDRLSNLDDANTWVRYYVGVADGDV
jgi:hypothetical protein